MYSSLIDAQVNAELTIVKIASVNLTTWLNHLGLYIGSQITRHDDEINFHPVRIRGESGDVVIPSGLGIKTLVHLDSGERRPLTEMSKHDHGHLETIAGGHGCTMALQKLGLEIGSEITFLRTLPHMDYIVTVNEEHRTRISEGEAARIWGKSEDGSAIQFYFARRGVPFTITDILGGRGVNEHLQTHGIALGHSMVLEGIQQAQEAHTPSEKTITVSSSSGLRLYLNLRQAGQIVVKSGVDDKTGEEVPPRSN